jgi:hypothetical protein
VEVKTESKTDNIVALGRVFRAEPIEVTIPVTDGKTYSNARIKHTKSKAITNIKE